MDPIVVDDGRRPGFEYRYQIEADGGGRTTDVQRANRWWFLCRGFNGFDFQIQTNFILRANLGAGAGETILCSETFSDYGIECDVIELFWSLPLRLKEYWMPEGQIKELEREASDLARSKLLPSARSYPRVIPITVRIDVCTVQQDGEELGAAMDRAIRVENLIPLEILTFKYRDEYIPFGLTEFFCTELTSIRLKDAADLGRGLGLMSICPICQHGPTVGGKLSTLGCDHTFHSHCIIRSLRNNSSCPVCSVRAHYVPSHTVVIKPGRDRDLDTRSWARVFRATLIVELARARNKLS